MKERGIIKYPAAVDDNYFNAWFCPHWFLKTISFISFNANTLKSRKFPSESVKLRTTIRPKDAARVSDGKSGKRISQSSSYSKTQDFEGRSLKKKQNFDKFEKLKSGEVRSMTQKPFLKRNEDNKIKISRIEKDSATSIKQSRPLHKHPQKIKHVTKGGYYHFSLTAIGGVLRLYFIVLHFPEGCVTKEKKLKLRRIPQKDNKLRRLALITPEIELIEKGTSAARFKCPIGLEIRPLMLPKDPVKSVQVEVTDNFNEVIWNETETLKLQKYQKFVSFKLQRFARVRVVCNSSTPLERQHYLFHALFVKRPTEISDPRKHIVKILIYSIHDKMCIEAVKVLRGPSVEVIAHRGLIQARPPCTFSASLICEGMYSFPESVDFDIGTVDQKVLETLTITIEKGEQDEEIPPWETVDLHYTAWIDKRGPPTILPFRWSVPADYRGSSCTSSVCSTFNVSGEGAVDSDAYSIRNPQSPCAGQVRFPSVSDKQCIQQGDRSISHNKKTPKRKMQDDDYGKPDKNIVTTPDQEESTLSEVAVSSLLLQIKGFERTASSDSGYQSSETVRRVVQAKVCMKVGEPLATKESEQSEVSVHDAESAKLDFEKTPKRKMQEYDYGTFNKIVVTKPDQVESILSEVAVSNRLQQDESGGPADSSDSEESLIREAQDYEKPDEDIVEKPNQEETVPSEGGARGTLQQDESTDSDEKVPFERSDGATDALRGSKQDECESASIHDIIKCAVKKDWLQKAVTSATIGHEGGKIELHNFEVIVPSGAIREEIEFEMSIDNNPKNYPRNEDPLTPILQVDPHVNFDRPVTVRMRTYVSAAAGGLCARILYRDGSTDSSWMHFKDVVTSDQNEVEFTVRHFTDFLAIVKEWLGISRPVYHSFINAYIQKKIGTILVIHVKDSKTAETLHGGLENRGYLQIIPLPKPVESTVSSEIPVQIECEKPSGVTYDQSVLERLSQPYQYVELRAKDFPKKFEENFEGKLFIKLGGKEVPPLNLFTDWQPESGSSHSTARVGPEGVKIDRTPTFKIIHGDSHCDKRQTRTAQNMADSGGVVNTTQNGNAEQQQG